MTDDRTPDGLPNALRAVDRHLVGPFGPGCSRWWARADDGERSLVTVVPGDVPGGTAEVRRRVATVQRLQHEHVASLGPLLRLPDDGLAVLEQYVEGHDLDTVRAARGPWSPGEVVAVLVPLANAVAALHGAGLRHRVTARNVVLTPDGSPVLVGLLGDGGVLGGGGPSGPDGGVDGRVGEDVAALGRLGLGLVDAAGAGMEGAGRRRAAAADPVGRLQRWEGKAVPARTDVEDRHHDARLRRVLLAATGPSAQHRPSATQLASELSQVCPPVRVEQLDPAVLAGLAVRRRPDAGDRGRHRSPDRPTRGWVQAGTAVLAVALCGVTVAATVSGSPPERGEVTAHQPVGYQTAVRSPDEHRAAPGAGGAAAADLDGNPEATVTLEVPEDPEDAAVLLTQIRARALVRGDLELLRRVTVPGSPAARGDEVAGHRAATAELAAGTLSTRIELAEQVTLERGAQCPGCVAVRLRSAVTVTSAGEPDGTAVQVSASGTQGGASASGRSARDVVLVLAPTDDGWRVSEVRPYAP